MILRWVVTPKVIDGKPSVKARLVARGFEELRLTLTIIASRDWTLNSLDVKTAFLQGKEISSETTN